MFKIDGKEPTEYIEKIANKQYKNGICLGIILGIIITFISLEITEILKLIYRG